MKKRNAKIHEFLAGNGGKPVCAKFGPKKHGIVASGDDKNAVSIWKLTKERPLMTLSSQTSAPSVTSEISAINFNINETEVISGTNRGSLSVWDINAQKLITTLKGHSVAINTIAHFPSPTQEHLLLTGSYDSTIKLWDLRQKQTVTTFKGHEMQVNCLEVTPDGKWFTSGAQDSLVKLWDIGTGKSIYTFNLHDAPVTCLKFNPYDLTLATGSADKTVKYWDLEKFGLICSTKAEATGIQNLSFDLDGKYLFSAAQDTLRVWYVDTNELILLDNVEATWRGVQDLMIETGKDDEENLLGLAISSVSFGLWSCSLKNVNRDSSISPEKFMQIRKQAEAKLKALEPKEPKRIDQPFLEEKPQLVKKPSSQEQIYERPERQERQERQDNYQKPIVNYQSQQPSNYPNQPSSNYLPPINYSNPNGNPQGMQQPGPNQYQPYSNIGYNNQYPPQNMYPPVDNYNSNNMGNNFPQQQRVDPRYANFPYGGGPVLDNRNLPNPMVQENVNMGGMDGNLNPIERVSLERKHSSEKSGQGQGQVQVHNAGLVDRLNNDNAMREEKPSRSEDSNNSKETTTIIEVNKAQLDQLNVSSFIKGFENDDKKVHFDTMSELAKDHSKFNALMKQRLDCLELVLHHWNSGNIRSALNAISKLNLNDSTLVMDLLNMSTAVSKTGQMTVEAACIFLQKAVLLTDSKFDHHVKMGFKFINKTFKQFYDEIIQIKTANVISMVDLAREERVKKYDKLINELEAISQRERIKKLAAKNKDEVGEMATRLLDELEIFLSRIKAGDSNRR